MAYDIPSLLYEWESLGIFDYVLPSFLIFAVVFGVLEATKAFGKNKGINLVVALVIGLMALRLDFVRAFFTEIFPRVGVALAVILTAVILSAAFIPKEHLGGWLIGFYSLGGLAALIVIFNSFNVLGWFNSYWWSDWGGMIIGALLVIGVIIAIAVSGGEKKERSGEGMKVSLVPWRS